MLVCTEASQSLAGQEAMLFLMGSRLVYVEASHDHVATHCGRNKKRQKHIASQILSATSSSSDD